MVRGGAIYCFTVYERDQTDMSFLCYHGSVRRNKGHVGKYRDSIVKKQERERDPSA